MSIDFESIEPKKVLDDAEFGKIRRLSREEFDKLPEATKANYTATYRYHLGERQKLPSLEGIVIGQLSIDEVLAGKKQPF